VVSTSIKNGGEEGGVRMMTADGTHASSRVTCLRSYPVPPPHFRDSSSSK